MNVREKLVELLGNIYLPMMDGHNTIGEYSIPHKFKEKIADHLISNGVTVQEWISVKDRLPEKDGQYLIFTTQYFTPDHIDEIDHKDGIEISGYCKRYGFLSENGLHTKYWRDIPQPPKGDKYNANRSVYDLDNANLNNTNLGSEIRDTEPDRYCIYGEIEAEEN